YSITFYASDNDATSRPDTVALSVTGGTGGGAMDATALLALALLAGGLRLRRTLALRRQCAPPA
ncbi:MAG: hypothetical protein Q7U14_16945, partial [Lacisediminimonas sp.]|nr:hypothetical protein [Lacisediminimonas sp.]